MNEEIKYIELKTGFNDDGQPGLEKFSFQNQVGQFISMEKLLKAYTVKEAMQTTTTLKRTMNIGFQE